ncbi:MAG: hypothetical protein AAF846_26650 [Chloroflexota bacterium]
MSDSIAKFERIREALVSQHENVSKGKMMSSEAITYKGKVFAFYGRDKMMCFKLGRDFKPENHNIAEYRILSPFKNKKPMVDWFLIDDHQQWDTLANYALNKMREQLD